MQLDLFRLTYRPLTDREKDLLHYMKLKAQELADNFKIIQDEKGPSREVSLAVTKLEEAVMWATKAIT